MFWSAIETFLYNVTPKNEITTELATAFGNSVACIFIHLFIVLK